MGEGGRQKCSNGRLSQVHRLTFQSHPSLSCFSPQLCLFSPSVLCQGNPTPAASDTIQTVRSPCPTLSPPEPDSKTARLLPHVPCSLPSLCSLSRSVFLLPCTHTHAHKHTRTHICTCVIGKRPSLPPLLAWLKNTGHIKKSRAGYAELTCAGKMWRGL